MNRPDKPLKRQIAEIAHRLTAIILCALALPACAQTEPASTQSNSTHADKFKTASDRLRDYGFTGVIALAGTGETPLFEGFGEGASAAGRPGPTTLVDIGSITKTITGAAAAKLIDDGKLSPADRLSAFFPDAPADKARITVHQLLTHSSGFTDAVGDDFVYLPKDGFIERAMAAPLLSEPGAEYNYSNVGFSMIAAIIEHVSGKTYEAFIREDLLGAVGVKDIGYEAVFSPERSLLTRDGDDIPTGSWGGRSHWALIGNGGLAASAADMIAFRRAAASAQLYSNAAVALAQSPLMREGEGAPSHYGYGMVVEDHPYFGRTYWHNGGNGEASSNLTDYADHGIIIFTASNNPNFSADLAALILAEALFDRQLISDETLSAAVAATTE